MTTDPLIMGYLIIGIFFLFLILDLSIHKKVSFLTFTNAFIGTMVASIILWGFDW